METSRRRPRASPVPPPRPASAAPILPRRQLLRRVVAAAPWAAVPLLLACGLLLSILDHWPDGGGQRFYELQRPPLYTEEELLPEGGPPLFKTAARRARDGRCLREGRARIKFLHMRKAGGTSIHLTLRRCNATGGPLHFHWAELYTYDARCLAEAAGPLVHITNLRDPMERIVSSFFYEGRNNKSTATPLIGYYDPHLTRYKRIERRNESEYLAFHEWAAWMLAVQHTYPADYRRNKMEASVDNYYIRTLVSRHRPDVDAPIGPADLDLAKRILASFDVVLISEWYGSREQQAYFRSYLGITGCDMQDGMPDARVDSSGFAIPHANRQERDEELMRDPRNKKMFDALVEVNKWDRALYEWAKHLVAARVAAAHNSKGDDTAASGGLHCPPLPSLPERAPLSEHTYEYAIQREYLHRETDIALAYPLAECMYPVLGHGGRRGSGM